MSKIIQLAIKERKVTIFLCLVVFAFGLYSYYFLPRQENPDISSPVAQIVTVFPGAKAEDVEKLVTEKIEDQVAMLDGIENLDSYSSDNFSVVVVFLSYDVDKDEQWTKLRTLISDIKPELPDSCYESTINTEMTDYTGLIIALSGENYNYEQLKDYADDFKENLRSVDGIKKLEINGELKKQLFIEVDNMKLAPLNLSILDVYNLIKAQNVNIPAGAIQSDNGKISVNVPNSIENIRDIEKSIVTISPDTGGIVRLGDIANIYFDYDTSSIKYKQDKDKAVLLSGYFDSGQNVVLIGNEVRKIVDDLKASLPEDLIVTEVVYQPEDVKNSVNDFLGSLFQGVIFVVLVVLIGMGLRNAMVVSAAIPLSIAITFVCMSLFNINIQQVSITALIVALGILVDNSIVISDAIQVHVNEGMELKEAAYLGAKKSYIPVLTSTLTTVVAFAPLATLPGEAGEMVMSLPIVVIIALIASYIVAMFVTPSLASLLFKPSKKTIKNNKLKDIFERMLKYGLKKPKLTIVIAFTLLIVSFLGLLVIPINLFPYVDKDIVYIDIHTEKSGDIDYTYEVSDLAEEILLNLDEIESVTTSIGGELPRFYMTIKSNPPSDSFAQLLCKINLTNSKIADNRQDFQVYLQDLLDKELVGGSASVQLLALNMPGPAIDIRMFSNNKEKLYDVADQVYSEILKDNRTISVKNNIPSFTYEYLINIDEDKAFNYGLTKYDIQYQINMSLNGGTASVFRQGGNEYDIYIKSNIETIDDIMNLSIKSQFTENKVLLKQFANVSLKPKTGTITRKDRMPSAFVQTNVRPGYSVSDVESYIKNEILTKIDTSEIHIKFEGDSATFDKYISGLGVAAVMALVAIYIILLMQFNSLKQPFIILASIPLSLIGTMAILVITGMEITFMVLIGVISLMGIVVNNAILLVEYINRARKDGMDVYTACVDSVGKRFRPIILSTVTTIIGLVPLALSNSSFYTPMAVALMGGLFVSTVFTMVVVPTIYSLVSKK